MMQALTDDPKEKINKAATKEKFTRFFDLLEEVMERHKLAKVMEDDEDGRETIGEEVIKLVIPSLQRFTQKHRDKEFSKSEPCFSFGVAVSALITIFLIKQRPSEVYVPCAPFCA